MTHAKKIKLGLVALCVATGQSWAQQASVTLYGLIDGGIAYQTLTGPDQYSQSRLGLGSGMQTTSRWGMRGQEPLGNGFTANFQLEGSFDVTNGAALANGRLFGTQSWVGLSSSYPLTRSEVGLVKLGWLSPLAQPTRIRSTATSSN